MRILIAEDDTTSRAMLKAVLEYHGHEVLETVDGEAAWREMQAINAPRMAIVDWMMPELDGLELVRRVRSLDTDRPPYVIMLTTKTEKTDIAIGLDAGADDYLSKPFDVTELRARIQVGVRVLDAQASLATKVAELREALDEIRVLHGILPICANCKKIRDDDGYWHQVDVYLSEHSEVDFSHGICPDCMKSLYPGLDLSELGDDSEGASP